MKKVVLVGAIALLSLASCSKEKGCTESLYGKKSKCIIKIVPQTKKCNTFQMDDSCKKKRLKTAKII